MPNTYITRYGLDFASSAGPESTMIEIGYFLPIYDYRFDGLIHDSTIPSSAFSACSDVDAVAPFGEVIWNTSAADYTLSDNNDNYLISAGEAYNTGTQIVFPVQSQKWQINLKNGIPLSNHWYGTSAAFDPAGGGVWNISDDTILVSGVNSADSGLDKYFPITDYYPVSADTDDSQIRGMVKCHLAKNIGECKFNAIALYAVQRDIYGDIIPGEPVFFAESQLKTTVVKTSVGNNGFDDITVDIQIDLHSISANWADVFFSTSGDYWARVPYGLYYPERIGVGEFDGDTDTPQATVHIRPPKDTTAVKLIRFERGRHYSTTDIQTGGGKEDIVYNNDLSASNGIITTLLDVSAGAIYPVSASSMDIGQGEMRFRYGYFDNVQATNLELSAIEWDDRISLLETSAISIDSRVDLLETSAISIDSRVDLLELSAVSINDKVNELENNIGYDGTLWGFFTKPLTNGDIDQITIIKGYAYADYIYDYNTDYYRKITTSSTIVKKIIDNSSSSSFVAFDFGTNEGGVALENGITTPITLSAGWYYLFAVMDASTGDNADFILDDNRAGTNALATLLNTYSLSNVAMRRIAMVYIYDDAGTKYIQKYFQKDDRFIWTDRTQILQNITVLSGGPDEYSLNDNMIPNVGSHIPNIVGIFEFAITADVDALVTIYECEDQDDYGNYYMLVQKTGEGWKTLNVDLSTTFFGSIFMNNIGSASTAIVVACIGYYDDRGRTRYELF